MRICAYILAAGLGSRLLPLTQDTPKPILDLGGSTCFDLIIKKMLQFGIKDIGTNVFYLKDRLLKHVAKNWKFVRVFEEPFLSGTGGAIKIAKGWLSNFDLILVHNADVLSGVDFSRFLAVHNKRRSLATLACNNLKANRYLCFNKEKNLTGWVSKKQSEVVRAGYITRNCKHFLGISVLSKESLTFFDLFEGEFSLISVLLNISKVGLVTYYLDKSFWLDIGTLETFKKAKALKDLDNLIGIKN